MSRSIINILGVVATLGVLALGILLVAMPLGFQALGVFGQTATVAGHQRRLTRRRSTALREEEDAPRRDRGVGRGPSDADHARERAR